MMYTTIRNLHLRLQVTLGMDRAVKHGSCQSYFYHFSTFLKSELIRDQTSGIQSNDSCMNSVAKRKLVEPSGIEPLTSCVQGRPAPSRATTPFNWAFLLLAALRLSLIQSHTAVCSFIRSGARLAINKKSCVKTLQVSYP